MGREFFYWWTGVVEDRRDPKKLGRLRVRILGAHTEIKQLIPTCELHWAYVFQSITNNQSMNGIGNSPTGPAEGTWVWGFFKDSTSAQEPIILGTVGGIPEEAPQPSLGFYDPSKPFHELENAPRKIRSRYYPNDGTGAQNVDESIASLYPRATHPWGCIIGEADTNRLARGENISDTIIGVQRRQRDVAIPIAFSHPNPTRKWNEPESAYNARYPYNHVYESESGHIVEIDDTPGHERIHLWHRQGTRIEINQEGDFSMKVVGKRFEVTMENSYSHCQNAMNLTVDGECNIYCRSDANLQVDGDLKVHVKGNYEEKIKGNYTTDIAGDRIVKVGGADEVSVGGSRKVAVGLALTESSGGKFSMTSNVLVAGDAPLVHFNSGLSSKATVKSPEVPPFPSKLGRTEGRNESGSSPVREEKPNPSPITNPQTDC